MIILRHTVELVAWLKMSIFIDILTTLMIVVGSITSDDQRRHGFDKEDGHDKQ